MMFSPGLTILFIGLSKSTTTHCKQALAVDSWIVGVFGGHVVWNLAVFWKTLFQVFPNLSIVFFTHLSKILQGSPGHWWIAVKLFFFLFRVMAPIVPHLDTQKFKNTSNALPWFATMSEGLESLICLYPLWHISKYFLTDSRQFLGFLSFVFATLLIHVFNIFAFQHSNLLQILYQVIYIFSIQISLAKWGPL